MSKNMVSVAEINEIVSESFGSGFFGDYTYSIAIIGESPEGLAERSGKLQLIGRKRLFGLLERVAGQLGTDIGPSTDGSVIVVLPKYEKQARQYSQVYHQRTGKEVRIIVSEAIMPSHDFGFVTNS